MHYAGKDMLGLCKILPSASRQSSDDRTLLPGLSGLLRHSRQRSETRFGRWLLPPVDLGQELNDVAPRIVGALAVRHRQAAGPLEILGDGMIDEGREWTAGSHP